MLAALILLISTLFVCTVAGGVCPSSRAKIHHSSCHVDISFDDSCSSVQAEINYRVSGTQSQAWVDPHNNGTYSIISNANNLLEVKRLTGDGKYTDLINFQMAENDGKCTVQACSESQVTSFSDFGTNFCNIHDLYCNEADCHPKTVLKYTEKVGSCTDSDSSKCFPK